MFVRPTQANEIFRNVSMPFGTTTIRWHSSKILRRSSQGNPCVGWVKRKRGSRILDLSNVISRKRCKIRAKLVLITNKKSHMSFRLVPNSATLDNFERRNSPNRRNRSVISPNSKAFGAHYVKVVEDTPTLFAAECRPKNLVFLAIYHLWRYWQGINPSESVKVRHSPLASENLTNNRNLKRKK